MSNKVRVRFAPSPTGPLHMGGVRTALYNYLFAKKNNGDFILRIEDTDQTRFVPGAEEYILESLEWCGFSPDEGPKNPGKYGPYKQSERKHLYKQYADQLINNGLAYYAFDTPDELDEMRERLKAAKVASPQYNSITRNSMKNSLTLSEDEVKTRLNSGDPYVIRIKIPRNEEVRFHDEIRGWVVVHSSHLDDKVLFKSDGMPTYHLANIVDDHLMEITHVIRGEEWLPSAPLHVLLYRFLGWEDTMPKLAHLPLILKPDGNGKLSKRDGDRLGFPVFPLEWKDPETGAISSGYREKGYFPEAFVNALAFLGWNPGTEQEMFTLNQLVEAFSIERVGKAGAKYDADKTKWFNQQYLREKSNEQLVELFKPVLEAKNLNYSNVNLLHYVELMKERAVFVEDMLEGEYFFAAPKSFDDKTLEKKWNDKSADIIQQLIDVLKNIENFNATNIETEFKAWLNQNQLGFGAVLPIFRIFVTGLSMGPSMFAICALLGKDETILRLQTGLNKKNGK